MAMKELGNGLSNPWLCSSRISTCGKPSWPLKSIALSCPYWGTIAKDGVGLKTSTHDIARNKTVKRLSYEIAKRLKERDSQEMGAYQVDPLVDRPSSYVLGWRKW